VRFRFVRDHLLSPADYGRLMTLMMAERGINEASLAEGLWINRDQIASLARAGHEIGLHSHTHPTVLGGLSAEDQEREYGRNFEVLGEIIGRPPISVAHPCNSYDEATLRILKSLGIIVGFRANMEPCGNSVLEFPREDHANIVRAMNPQ
jgi:peptidoglycan/xylan/chitin deacetylase (PgdA/CDA1 family)